jgi:hypothetical protein
MLARAAGQAKAGEVKAAASTVARTVTHFVKHPPKLSGGIQMGKLK